MGIFEAIRCRYSRPGALSATGRIAPRLSSNTPSRFAAAPIASRSTNPPARPSAPPAATESTAEERARVAQVNRRGARQRSAAAAATAESPCRARTVCAPRLFVSLAAALNRRERDGVPDVFAATSPEPATPKPATTRPIVSARRPSGPEPSPPSGRHRAMSPGWPPPSPPTSALNCAGAHGRRQRGGGARDGAAGDLATARHPSSERFPGRLAGCSTAVWPRLAALAPPVLARHPMTVVAFRAHSHPAPDPSRRTAARTRTRASASSPGSDALPRGSPPAVFFIRTMTPSRHAASVVRAVVRVRVVAPTHAAVEFQ